MAIASLILGMTFVVPLVAAILAVGTGLLARKLIESSQGRLLGKGVATIGMSLGAIQGIVWVLILFAGMVYVVHPTETAVVVRSNEPSELKSPGLHFKVPFLESVALYPTGYIFEVQTEPVSTSFESNTTSDIVATLNWRVCDSIRFFKTWGTEFREGEAANRLTILAERYLKRANHRAENADDFMNDFKHRHQMSESINKSAERFGLCVVSLKIEVASGDPA